METKESLHNWVATHFWAIDSFQWELRHKRPHSVDVDAWCKRALTPIPDQDVELS